MVSDPPDALICDLDGVVYRGDVPIEGVPETLGRLRARGTEVLFCSNNSNRSIEGYVEKLGSIGIPAEPSEILTSATVLGDVLEGQSGRALCIGGPGLKESVSGAGLEVVSEPPAELVCVGFDPLFDYDAMRGASTALLDGARFLATNDDASFPAADGLWPGAGAILASIERATGRRATVLGKPHGGMIASARARLEGARRIVVVGDRIDTDIEMARSAGWGSCLVLSGVTSAADLGAGPVADEVYESLAHAPWAQ